MGCDKKGKKRRQPKPGDYQCKSCDAVAESKKKLCKPKKVKRGKKD